MNDHLSIIKEDLIKLAKNIINKNILDNNFNLENISIDYLSKSKQGDISTNLLILIKNNLIEKDYQIEDFLYQEIKKFNYIKNIKISKNGFLNIFFHNDFIFNQLKEIFHNPSDYGKNNIGNLPNFGNLLT